ncbi:MAG: prepilin-type N-terminal cleavage/methylation domain-containing protein [Candidatus Gastranaerophilales bacterium]
MKLLNGKRTGFTLAEVLITLGIIGVVSAMTIPNLISNMQQEGLDKKKLLFEGRLEEAMNQMRFHEKLTGYDSAEDFVTELGKYLKINETCELGDIDECFVAETINNCEKAISLEDLKTGEDFVAYSSSNDFSSDNVGVIFADGTKAIVNYDLNCEWLDPYESGLNRSEATKCIAMLADVNGNRGKNTLGSDILPINTTLGEMLDDVCWDLNDTIASTVNCSDASGSNYQYCGNYPSGYTDDNWAGAMKACIEAGKRLPTMNEITDLHMYIFDNYTLFNYESNNDIYSGLTLNTERVAEFNLSQNVYSNTRSYQWSSEETSSLYASARYFTTTSSEYWVANYKNTAYTYSRCVQ